MALPRGGMNLAIAHIRKTGEKVTINVTETPRRTRDLVWPCLIVVVDRPNLEAQFVVRILPHRRPARPPEIHPIKPGHPITPKVG